MTYTRYCLRISGKGWKFLRDGHRYTGHDSEVCDGPDGATWYATRDGAEQARNHSRLADSLVVEEALVVLGIGPPHGGSRRSWGGRS